jgi:hypothetical protein
MPETRALIIRADAEALAALAPLAREGFGIDIAAGRSLRQTLAEDLGLGTECVEKRIQTVFLDGSPVDDIDADHARPGSALALAGALPGVAGICMQRQSRIGVYREGITHQAAAALPATARSLRITLKLFNVVAVECLAQVLSHGVEVRSGRLAELLEDNPEALARAELSLDGQPISRDALAHTLRGQNAPLRLKADQ